MSKDERDKLGKFLWKLRRDRNWTQEQMARAIGISRVALSLAENGTFAGKRSKSLYLINKFLEGIAP